MFERTKYQTARQLSGLTQEKAVEFLHTSVSNLRRIETGQQQCTADMEQAMARLYGAPWVADKTVPADYKPLPRAQAILRYINERDDVDQLMPRARRILADGVVDKSEVEEFAMIAREIEEERIAGRDLLYAR